MQNHPAPSSAWLPCAPITDTDRIDLHTHSAVSDGTESPGEVIAQAQRAGLQVVALTDHDTCASWDEAAAAADGKISLLLGTEVSTRLRGASVHILAYGYQRGAELDQLLVSARSARVQRLEQMTQKLREYYPRLSWKTVQAQVAGENTTLGRPHLADALVSLGYLADRAAAFAGPLAPNSRCYVDYSVPSPVESIAAIRAAGGVAVIAHPFSRTRTFALQDADLQQMKAAGMAGIEVYHRDHGEAETRRALQLAHELDLIVTGASDYHGAGKPNRLGENLTPPQSLRKIIDLLHANSGRKN